jgi:aryl-alcohol dehydrogenase-like predicted oxidoreductase
MGCSWNKVVLGRTGLEVMPLGLGSSYGVGRRDVERAIERGIGYVYWGSVQRPGFGAAIAHAARRRRDAVVTVVQTYTRVGSLMRLSLEQALRRLRIEYTDILLLGWWNQPPPRRVTDAALALRDAGKVRHIMISGHHRTLFPKLAADPIFGAIMVRYNAAHPGAENEVFGRLGHPRPGVVAYTATRWGGLCDPRLVPVGESVPRASDCYRFALSHPEVDVVLAGPKDGTQLDEAMAGLDRGPMNADELAWMRRVGAAVRQASLARGVAEAPVTFLDRFVRRIAGGT